MAQKTIIDTLHKQGKSQKVISERGGYSQSVISKHFWYKEEIGLGKKRASQGVDLECIKSHHVQTSSGKRLPGHLRKSSGLLLSVSKSSFQIKLYLAFNLEIKVWRKPGESKLLEVQCEDSNQERSPDQVEFRAVNFWLDSESIQFTIRRFDLIQDSHCPRHSPSWRACLPGHLPGLMSQAAPGP